MTDGDKNCGYFPSPSPFSLAPSWMGLFPLFLPPLGQKETSSESARMEKGEEKEERSGAGVEKEAAGPRKSISR